MTIYRLNRSTEKLIDLLNTVSPALYAAVARTMDGTDDTSPVEQICDTLSNYNQRYLVFLACYPETPTDSLTVQLLRIAFTR